MDTSFVFTQVTNAPDTFSKILPLLSLVIGSLLTLTITLISEKLKARTNRKKTKEFFVYSLNELLDSTKMQVDVFTRNIEDIEYNERFHESFEYVLGFHLQNINLVSANELFHIFILRKSRNQEKSKSNLVEFLNSVELLKSIIDNAEIEEKSFREKNWEYEHEFFEDYREFFMKIKEHIKVTLSTEINANPILKRKREAAQKLDKVFEDYGKDPSFAAIHSVISYFEYVVEPVTAIEKEYLLGELHQIILEVRSAYFIWDENRKHFVERFTAYKNRLERINKALNDTITFLK